MRAFARSSPVVLIVLAIPLTGCGLGSKQESPPAKEIAKAEVAKKETPKPDPVVDGAATGTEITLHVEGMV